MRFINILVGVVLPLAGLFAWLWFGYVKTNEQHAEDGTAQVTFDQYVIAWMGDLAKGDAGEGGVTRDLSAMFPTAPEGWTQRKVKDSDIGALTVNGLNPRHQALALEAALPDPGPEEGAPGALTQARTAWDGPKGALIAELVRAPDLLFKYPAGAEILAQNAAVMAAIPQQPLLYIGGLQINEAVVPPQVPARILLAELEQQVVLRVSAPKTMTDAELRDFFATLNVASMNHALHDPLTGMGAVKLDKAKLVALTASLTAAEESAIATATAGFDLERARIRAAREAAWAKLSPEDLTKGVAELSGEAVPVTEASGEVMVRRGVGNDDPGRSTLKTSGGNGKPGGPGECKEVGGRKICGVAAPQAE